MKKNNLTILLGMLLLVIGISTGNSYAQKTAPVNEAVKSVEPQKQAQKGVLQTYIDMSGLPMLEKQKIMRSSVSAEEKAALMRFHLAFQLVTRPNLTAEQRR